MQIRWAQGSCREIVTEGKQDEFLRDQSCQKESSRNPFGFMHGFDNLKTGLSREFPCGQSIEGMGSDPPSLPPSPLSSF